ncbi:MAG: small-conductance mechanosensitive channel [Bacteroidia bacterium]|jgi:small-conductance mechanosensitive channel
MNDFLAYHLVKLGSIDITVGTIVMLIIVYIGTKILLFIFKRLIKRHLLKASLAPGRLAALYQIVKYFVWFSALMISLQIIGIELTFLLASSAALMVGIGLGLQNIFNDFVSGIILLLEGSVDKGDIISIGEMVGEVQQIHIRTSVILTRNNISIIVPNHKLVEDNVINWSHLHMNPRFLLKVGVAYGSKTRMVQEILLKVAKAHELVDQDPAPFVRFRDFDDSALSFELYFWCGHVFRIEDVLSDMRYQIDDEFRANDVVIPFPQRDVHIKEAK